MIFLLVVKHVLGLEDAKEPASDDCFLKSTSYQPLGIPGEGRSVEKSASDCQARCFATEGCAHFSFWGDGGCHLSAESSTLKVTPGVISGPSKCQGAVAMCNEDDAERFWGAVVERDNSRLNAACEGLMKEGNFGWDREAEGTCGCVEALFDKAPSLTKGELAQCFLDVEGKHVRLDWFLSRDLAHCRGNCFGTGTYQPLGVPGEGRSVENSPSDCQARCSVTEGCAYFTFWGDGGCILSAESATLQETRGVISGPSKCPEISVADAKKLVNSLAGLTSMIADMLDLPHDLDKLQQLKRRRLADRLKGQ